MLRERFSEVSLTTLPPLRVACFRAVSLTPEDDALAVLRQWAAGARLARSFGFDVDVSPEQAQAGQRGYELWVVVDDPVAASPPVTIHEFPGGHYAAMTIYDPFSDPFAHIPAGWERLHEWVAARGIGEADKRLCLEEVVEQDGQTDMILYYAVRA